MNRGAVSVWTFWSGWLFGWPITGKKGGKLPEKQRMDTLGQGHHELSSWKALDESSKKT